MAGIDNITSRILAEAQGEADALLAKAAEEAKGIIGEAPVSYTHLTLPTKA